MNKTLKYLKSLIPKYNRHYWYGYKFLVTANGSIFNRKSLSTRNYQHSSTRRVKAMSLSDAKYKVRRKMGPDAVIDVFELGD